jgi:hypothetical protein
MEMQEGKSLLTQFHFAALQRGVLGLLGFQPEA